MTALHACTAGQLRALLGRGEVGSGEIVENLLARLDRVEPEVGAFLSWDGEDARARARASDERRRRGEGRGALEGIPVALKDIVAVEGQPLGCASRILAGFRSPYTATAVRRLEEAGAVVFGRLNMDEFAMGSSTENSGYHSTANPWDLQRVPGGSSGGSAAAVAAGEAPIALGSDTGGSIRQPAAFCGTVGLKPTYGRISRYGLVAFASSLDQIGPLARSVEDVALFLDATCGHDPRDSTSLPAGPPAWAGPLGPPDRPLRLGVPREFFGEGLAPDVKAAVEKALRFYEEAGHSVEEVELPHAKYGVAVYYIVATAEASSNLARFDGIRYGQRAPGAEDGIDLYYRTREEGFGPEVIRRILLGTYVLSSGYYDAYYLRAQKVRTLVQRDFAEVFARVDALVSPATPTVAFREGDKIDDPLAMYLNDIYTIPANLAGLPALSVPCGFSAEGMPIGLQLMAPVLEEERLLRLAWQFEEGHDFRGQVAPVGGEGGSGA
jgi:aspartyl-tRNA(Asn)/glutamyl-tRNA(Gln) amidotransferase subunit A